MSNEDETNPFTNSRLRSFTGRMDSSIDGRMSIANAMALAPDALFSPLDKLGASQQSFTGLSGKKSLFSSLPAKPESGLDSSLQGTQQLPEAALNEIFALKSEIAGIEALLGQLKKVLPSINTKGRSLEKTRTEEQLRIQAEAHKQRIHELKTGQGAPPSAAVGGWEGNLRDTDKPRSRSEGWGLERGGAPATITPVGRGEAVVLAAALDEALPEGALTAKYAHPAAAAKVAAVKAAEPALHADSVLAAKQLGRTHSPTNALPASVPPAPGSLVSATAPLPKAAVNTKRNRQSQLSVAAAATTVSGVAPITLKVSVPVHADALKLHLKQQPDALRASATSLGEGSLTKQSAAQLLLSSQNMQEDMELLSMTAKETARQVASHCAERAQVILKVDSRYQEAFGALHTIVDALHTTNSALVARLGHAHAHASTQAMMIESMEDRLTEQAQVLEDKDAQLTQLQCAHETLQWDSQQTIASLTSQNTILANKVEHYSGRLEEEQAAFHDLVEERMASSLAQIASLTDERDDLHQRLRFLEKQNAYIRHENSRLPTTSHSSVQTDPVKWQAELEEDDAAAGQGEQTQLGGLEWLPTDAALGKLHSRGGPGTNKKRRRPMHLGGFLGMISIDKPGRVRGPMWTTSTIAHIYADKTIHDVVCDRESNPRSPICNFIHDWHITKYGLKHLADASLMDLIASVRHHQRTSARIGWFAQFTGLDEGNTDALDSSQHLSFYLFVLQQLMFPSSLTAAFPDAPSSEGGASVAGSPSDVPLLLRAQQVIEATKAIFRYLNDPDAVTSFIARHVEPTPVIASLLPPDASGANGGAGARAQQSGSNASGPGSFMVPFDPLVKAFMAEFQKRTDKNIAHLKALFKAGDIDRDGFINYDEFVALIRLAAPDVTERLVTKAYTEAVRDQPHGCFLVSCPTFIHVARNFGFDRWKVDASIFACTLPGMGPVGGAALLAEGGVPALLSARKGSMRPSSSGSQNLSQLKQEGSGPAPPSPPHSTGGSTAVDGKWPVSPYLRGIERFDTERGIKACLEGCLVGMRPSLEESMADARCRLRSPTHPTYQHLEKQWQHFQSALAVARGQAEAPPSANPTPQPATTATDRQSSSPLSLQHPRTAGSSARPNTNTTTAASATVHSLPPAPAYPPANAAHAWLCFQLLYESLMAGCNNTRSSVWGGCSARASSSGSSPRGGPALRAVSPPSGQRRMLIQPAMPWRSGPVSPASSPQPSGASAPAAMGTAGWQRQLRAHSASAQQYNAGPAVGASCAHDGMKALAALAQQVQPSSQQQQLMVYEALATSPRVQEQQQQQQQWDAAQALRVEAFQKQQQEQQQLQEIARALRSSAQQQQQQQQRLCAIPPQVMQLDLQRQRLQKIPVSNASEEFEFAPALGGWKG